MASQRILRLGLPLREPGYAWLSALCIFVVYAATMARDLTFYDSPELALVAHELGVGHPIGMPLHTLVGFVFSRLAPTPHLGLSTMSALFGALSVIPAWSLADRLGEASGHGRWLRVAVFVGVGVSLVGWEPSTRVEVYTLAVFLSLWGVARTSERPGFAGGVAFGLAACSNAVIAVAHALSVVPRGLSDADADADAEPVGRVRAALLFLAGGLAGLLPYALLPIAAADPRRFAWGATTDGAALLAYLRGADYRHNQGITFADWSDHLGQLLSWGLTHGTLPVAVVGGLAFFALGRRRARIGWSAIVAGPLVVAFVAANIVFHPDVPDYRGYFLGPLWLCGAGISAAAENLWRRASEPSASRFRFYSVALAAVPLLALLPSHGHLTRVRDDPSLARLISEAALQEAPDGAILVVEADHLIAPLLYLQEVEDLRPDVVVLALGLASSSWYWDHIYARHETLTPFELVTRGGDNRAARVRRFLGAQPDRPVLVESSRVAYATGRIPCGVGALVWTSGPGAEPSATCGDPGPDMTSAAIEAAAPFFGESLEVAARFGEARGETLWRLGSGRSAFVAMVAGLHRSGVGPAPLDDLPTRAAPLTGALPTWTRPAALHDPARNLALAGLILHASGRSTHAVRFVNAARTLGLEEAVIAGGLRLGHR